MKKLMLISLSLISFFAVASNPISLTEYLSNPSNPLKINLKIDETQSVKSLINAKLGGSIKLKNKNGDLFTLTIEPDSLPFDTEITMEAISDFSQNSLDIKTAVSGVNLSPEGLVFLKPATLSITQANPIKAEPIVPVTTNKDGSEASIAFIDLKKSSNNTVSLTLLHFSTYNVFGSRSAGEVISNAFNSSTLRRIESYVAEQMMKDKNGDPVDPDYKYNSLKEAFDKVFIRQLSNIETCAGGLDATESVLGYLRELQLLGIKDGEIVNISLYQAARSKTAKLCKEQFEKACFEDHHPFHIYEPSLAFIRQNQLLHDPIEAEFRELLVKCFNFDLEVFSTFKMPKDSGVSITALGKVNISLDELMRLKSRGIIQVKDIQFQPEGLKCSVKTFVNPAEELKIKLGMMDLKFDQTLYAYMSPLTPKANAVFTCKDEDGTKMDIPVPGNMGGGDKDFSFWGGMFQAFHSLSTKNEYNEREGRYEIYKWDVLYKELFAEKHYKRNQDELDEETDFYIYHRPLK